MAWLTDHLLTIAIFLPLVGVFSIACLRRERPQAVRWVALLASLLTFFVTLILYASLRADVPGMQFVEIHPWISAPEINYHIGADGLSALLILLAGFLTPLCVLVSWSSITKRVKEFFIFLLALEAGMIGVFAALDLMLFFVFWEVMLIPMYFLIGIWGHERRVYAAVKFILYTMVGIRFDVRGHSLSVQRHGNVRPGSHHRGIHKHYFVVTGRRALAFPGFLPGLCD